MRVAILSWESLHSVAAGGVASHVTELAAALCRRGHDVHLFTRIELPVSILILGEFGFVDCHQSQMAIYIFASAFRTLDL